VIDLSDEYLNDLHQWDQETLFWRECLQVNRISKRVSAGAASLQGSLYIFGGTNETNRLNDLQVWNPTSSSWSEINTTTPGPTPREGHGFIAIESLRKIYVLGGVVNISGQDHLSSDFFEFDLDTSDWSNISHLNTISARSHFGITSTNDKIFVFSGISEGNVSCALHEFSTTNTMWKCMSSSEHFGYPLAFYITPGIAFSESRLYTFGGLNSPGKYLFFKLFKNPLIFWD
jgi:N-acetylneuraminic acid mutarotase